MPKEELGSVVEDFTMGVLARIRSQGDDGPDAVHANYWLSGLTGHVCKHEFGLPLVSTFHTLDRVKAEASVDDIAAGEPERRALAESQIVACSDAILASCEVEADQLVELYGAERSRIHLVPPGVDHAFFAPGNRGQARRALGLDPSVPLLLFVGRIQPLKGVEVAVQAFALLKERTDATLAIVGGPSGALGCATVERVERLVAEAGLEDRVLFVPPQPHELLSTWYRAAEACLVPSRSESFGLVALEAAACGTPVIAADVGGLSTLVDHGRTGYLVDGHEPNAFAHFAGLVLADPDRARRLSVAASARASAYTWSQAATDLLGVYNGLERELVDCI